MSLDFDSIPKEMYALLGAAVGATVALASTFITQFFTRSIERERVHGARFQQAATDFSSAAHALLWTTWHAKERTLTKEMITKYHDEMHLLLPKIVGSHVAISAIDKQLAELTSELVDQIHDIDERIAKACIMWIKNQTAGSTELEAAHQDALKVDMAVYKNMAEIVMLRRSRAPRFALRIFRSLLP